MKKNLEALLKSIRGHEASPLALATVQKMSEKEASEWFELLTLLIDQSKVAGVALICESYESYETSAGVFGTREEK